MTTACASVDNEIKPQRIDLKKNTLLEGGGVNRVNSTHDEPLEKNILYKKNT